MNSDSINKIDAKRVIKTDNPDDDYLFPEAYFYEDGAEKDHYGTFVTRYDIVTDRGLLLKGAITEDSYNVVKGDQDLDINKDLIGFPTGPDSYTDWPKKECNLEGKLPFTLKPHFLQSESPEIFKGQVIIEFPERPASSPEIFEHQNEINKEN